MEAIGTMPMKAMVWTKYGPPDVLRLKEVAKPTPKDNEILIRIHATTVTLGEVEVRGLRFPFLVRILIRLFLGVRKPKRITILGQELAGDIEVVGKEVTRFKVGDQLFGWTGFHVGADAEYICLPARGPMSIKPPYMTYEEAATLPVGGADAAFFMKQGDIRSGQKLLINGAGGCIGTYAVQIAKYLGAEVTAVDSAEKLDMLRSIGADHVIDYKREDFTKRGETYDAIFDVVGKAPFTRATRMLTPNGRYLMGNPPVADRIRARRLARRSSKRAISWTSRSSGEYTEYFNYLKELFEAGKIRAVIDKCYPLEQLAEAHRYVEQGHKKGHVVIIVAQDNEA